MNLYIWYTEHARLNNYPDLVCTTNEDDNILSFQVINGHWSGRLFKDEKLFVIKNERKTRGRHCDYILSEEPLYHYHYGHIVDA